jgi:hypothetical protein
MLGLSSNVGEVLAGDVSSSFDLDDCDACGIDKLTSAELANLVATISAGRGISYLDESAGQYLRKQGWAPTEIIGYQPDTSIAAGSDDVLMLVVREGKLYAMEPPIGEDAWEVGVYWSKDTFISSWQVISPEGEVENCDIAELR